MSIPMLPLGWYDDTKGKTTATKLCEAVAAYVNKFGHVPNLILVNEADALATCPGCAIQVERRIGLNNYHIGRTE